MSAPNLNGQYNRSLRMFQSTPVCRAAWSGSRVFFSGRASGSQSRGAEVSFGLNRGRSQFSNQFSSPMGGPHTIAAPPLGGRLTRVALAARGYRKDRVAGR